MEQDDQLNDENIENTDFTPEENIEETPVTNTTESTEQPVTKKEKKQGAFSTMNVLKISTKAFFIVTWRIAYFVIIGLIINVVLYILIDNQVDLLLNSNNVSFGWTLIGYGIIALFFAGFPLLYFILGQKHGVQTAIYYLLNEAKEFLFVYLVDKFFVWVSKRPDLQAKVTENRVNSLLNETLPYYLKKLHGMGFIFKIIFRKFTGMINYKELLLHEIDEIGGKIDVEALKEHVAEEAARKIPLVIVSKPKLTPLFILMGINAVVFLLVKIFAVVH